MADGERPATLVGMKTYRVVQWSTGGVGALAIGALSARPDLDLVGVCLLYTSDAADEL